MSKFLSQNEKTFYITEIVTAVIGTAASFYLLVQHTRLTHGIQDSASFCSFGQFADCDVVNASQYASLLGIPLGTWGASYFFLLLALILVAPPRDKSFRFFQGLLGWFLCFGLAFDIVYLGIQILILKTVCLVCLLTYVSNGILLFATLRLTPGTGSRLKKLLLEVRNGKLSELQARRAPFALVCWVLFTLVTLLAPAQILKKSANYAHADQALEQFFEQWKERPVKKLEATEGNGTWGDPNSKIVVVEFSDFECPFCRKAAFTLHTVLQPLKDRLYFIFKNFPLDSTCNPALPYQIHAHACKLAKLATCGTLKGKFWDVHDQLFLRLDDNAVKKGFDFIADSLKNSFTDSEISQCLNDPKAAKLVSEDIKLGQTLNVRGTPALFINGKQVTIPITLDSFRRLITLEEKLVLGKVPSYFQ